MVNLCDNGDDLDLGKNIRNVRALYGTEKPKQVTFAITNHCNMVCTTCSFPNVPSSKKRHVSLKDAKYAIDFFQKHAVKMISITGGEPTLDMHRLLMFVSLLKYRKPDTKVYVYTNGDLLTREEADMMKVAGVDGINWSPHGGIDNYQRNHWAFIHSCVIPVRMRIQDTMIHDDLIQWCDNNGIEVCEWSIGDCYDMPDEDRYEISWRD